MMQLSDIQKLILNFVTIAAWLLGILISLFAVTKGRKMKAELGVSFTTYMTLVGITEVLYTVGAAMILSAMGVNILRHLANLDIWRFFKIMSRFDWSTVRIIGVVGWIGFVINRSISFVSPGYLLLAGRKKLPRYFYYSAWTEIGLETLMTILIFVSLIAG
ncbi:MAG: hypothetical protein M1461_12970 [Nitrospirae bacterium]|nr:hypothetical protein [Nitrospirota bacterium]